MFYKEWTGKASLISWYVSRDLKETRAGKVFIWERNVLDRGGPELGSVLAISEASHLCVRMCV